MQYYVAGRAAARVFLTPIYGNLLHHAVEMFLKYTLIAVLSAEEMRSREYGHNLVNLWRCFKEKEAGPEFNADPALDRFDVTIRSLHEFEELRYPDNIRHGAIMMALTWLPDEAVTTSLQSKPKQFEITIDDVDRLVMEILKRTNLNPRYFSNPLSAGARKALRHLNPYFGLVGPGRQAGVGSLLAMGEARRARPLSAATSLRIAQCAR